MVVEHIPCVADVVVEAAAADVRASPWDTVAGVRLVRQAGGTVTDLHGEAGRHDSTGLVASTGTAHDAVLATARGDRPE